MIDTILLPITFNCNNFTLDTSCGLLGETPVLEEPVMVWVFGLFVTCFFVMFILLCHCFLPFYCFPSLVIVVMSFTCPWLASCVFESLSFPLSSSRFICSVFPTSVLRPLLCSQCLCVAPRVFLGGFPPAFPELLVFTSFSCCVSLWFPPSMLWQFVLLVFWTLDFYRLQLIKARLVFCYLPASVCLAFGYFFDVRPNHPFQTSSHKWTFPLFITALKSSLVAVINIGCTKLHCRFQCQPSVYDGFFLMRSASF